MPGRGAHLHPDLVCLAQAVKRRAFGRALRVTGIVLTEPLDTYLADGGASRTSPGLSRQDDPYEHPMKHLK